ncbi:hypothetical protein ACEWY4_004097 [Coilia grayii]|uniref:Uncharacterized protein n=1 Tax=Coilia grayii TaxID=363190 RepID=A0ABD1KKP6_9TELE
MSTMRGTRNILSGVLITALLLHSSEGWLLEQMVNRREYEVVRPVRLHRRYNRETKLGPDEMKYRLTLNGKDVKIDLKRNGDLITQDYSETHYTSEGIRVTTPNTLEKSQCYYLGKIVGDSHSAASLNTCRGLSGFIRAAGQEYVIEPLAGSDTGDHAMVKYSNLRQVPWHCGVNTSMNVIHGHPSFSVRGRSGTKSPLDIQKYIEMFLVVDHREYLNIQEDIDKTRERMFQLMNFVNMVYRPLRTAVVLVGLDIWTDSDKIPVEKDSEKTLEAFTAWRNDVLMKIRIHDSAQLVTALQFNAGVVGSAYIGSMCSAHATGVVQDHSKSVIPTASTFAHELGHNLGMEHDEGEHCACVDPECIMTKTLGDSSPRHFSSCSVADYTSYLQSSNAMACLTVNPLHKALIPVCGNAILEEGEQCDCGSPEECTSTCCRAVDCKFVQSTKQCRAQGGECDLPEYCTGSSADCPEDTFVQNGSPCSGNKGYCFNSQCPTRDSQCMAEWGKDAQEAEDQCYKSDSTSDAMCEMLLCITGNKDQNSNSGHMCTDVTSKNEVLNGTRCSEGKVCMGKRCVELGEAYEVNYCQQNCTGHKVCNNKRECQCEAGWMPPHCDIKYEGGLDFTLGKASGLGAGAVIAIVVVIAVAVLTLVALALVKAVCYCRDNKKKISKHSHTSSTPHLGLDNSALEKEEENVYEIYINANQVPPKGPHPSA